MVVSSSTDDAESSPIRHRRSPAASPASNYLLEALQRIRALQDELDFLENDPYAEDTDDEELNDGAEAEDVQVIGGQQAEAIGWAVCAREAIQFLQHEGIPADSPLMVNLRQRLIGTARPPDGAGHDEGLSC
ncbi:uncharacterized protein LOC126572673 [Anopheles aquasalis]|uniref:uncharacterized protein LOC126572673 n=1 Tax=Anopheles aquasalis TaxID=42839 RepID=UPI00215B3C87|nr:uncharacterized protein LOC126572673 [Anopheles aquasalis]